MVPVFAFCVMLYEKMHTCNTKNPQNGKSLISLLLLCKCESLCDLEVSCMSTMCTFDCGAEHYKLINAWYEFMNKCLDFC